MDKLQSTSVKVNIFNDEIAEVQYYKQFAYANVSHESRIEAITNIASICYQNPKALGSESLYKRLEAEAAGLPSSSFEFVPVLIKTSVIVELLDFGYVYINSDNPLVKYGEWVEDGKYLLTNYRAIVYLYEQTGYDLRDFFNSQEECDIISKHYHVFHFKVDLSTRAQMVRHRLNWQELSRRYVSGKKSPFQFYISQKMKTITVDSYFYEEGGSPATIDTSDYVDIGLRLYDEALSKGVKPEEARRILPQAMYTDIWGGFQPAYLANFFELRLDTHAQKEIRLVAEAMKSLIEN